MIRCSIHPNVKVHCGGNRWVLGLGMRVINKGRKRLWLFPAIMVFGATAMGSQSRNFPAPSGKRAVDPNQPDRSRLKRVRLPQLKQHWVVYQICLSAMIGCRAEARLAG